MLGKTEFRFEFSVKNYVFQHRTKFWHFLKKCKFWFFGKCRFLKFITSKTHWNGGFQRLGVSKNDFSWSKAAWSIFQSLFWLKNRWLRIENTEAENLHFFKDRWKPSQKMRLDVLIIFHIEWPHQVSSLVGKQSKYWS